MRKELAASVCQLRNRLGPSLSLSRRKAAALRDEDKSVGVENGDGVGLMVEKRWRVRAKFLGSPERVVVSVEGLLWWDAYSCLRFVGYVCKRYGHNPM